MPLAQIFTLLLLPILLAGGHGWFTNWLAVKLLQLSGRGDAMASIVGLGVMMDEFEITWDDTPLRERDITPRSATEWIEAQAAALPAAP